jgi:hypothetical protein
VPGSLAHYGLVGVSGTTAGTASGLTLKASYSPRGPKVGPIPTMRRSLPRTGAGRLMGARPPSLALRRQHSGDRRCACARWRRATPYGHRPALRRPLPTVRFLAIVRWLYCPIGRDASADVAVRSLGHWSPACHRSARTILDRSAWTAAEARTNRDFDGLRSSSARAGFFALPRSR